MSNIVPITLEEEMKRSYLDYAMSVIVSRALPDIRDGLKPVHRRILFAMKEGGYDYNKLFRKAARIIGDVMGKYHPHGDSAIYDAMVRMAQSFSMRLVLVDGQGNFGSMDGDPPAAMRYTEARLTRVAHALLEDVERDTVDFRPNYDETTKEPTVLPACFPNILVNGAGGIAVGMATNIPPHNLGEIIDATCAYIDNPSITHEDLIEFVKAPDFPTGGIILGWTDSRIVYTTGHGSITIRGRCHIETLCNDREAIIITEIPYQVNKARLVEAIASLVRSKRVESITELRDESDRYGVRIVIEIGNESSSDIILNQLYRLTPLQTTFGVNMLVLHNGQPELMTLRSIIAAFVSFREEILRRRTIFELDKARGQAHILVGLAIALTNLDSVVSVLRTAQDLQTASKQLVKYAWSVQNMQPLTEFLNEQNNVTDGYYFLSEPQVHAILNLRLQRLTKLEREQLYTNLHRISKDIRQYSQILSSRQYLYTLLREELVQIKEDFATDRRSTIEAYIKQNVTEDPLQEDMVIIITNTGYIKRVPLSVYCAQRHAGRGRASMVTQTEDCVSHMLVASTRTIVLLFSSSGIAYVLRVHKLPIESSQSRGKAIVNILPLELGETISAILALPEDTRTWNNLYIIFATASGYVRRNILSDFTDMMVSGKIAMKLREGDRLIGVQACTDKDDILLATRNGRCIRFSTSNIRVFSGRISMGVRGIQLVHMDEVISMSILTSRNAFLQEHRHVCKKLRQNNKEKEEHRSINLMLDTYHHIVENKEFILSLTDSGFGKRTLSSEYRVINRGGQGFANVATYKNKKREVIASFPVYVNDQIIMISDNGQTIHLSVYDIRIAHRATLGVTVFRTSDSQRVVSAVRLLSDMYDGIL